MLTLLLPSTDSTGSCQITVRADADYLDFHPQGVCDLVELVALIDYPALRPFPGSM